jgi:hypothetical protein
MFTMKFFRNTNKTIFINPLTLILFLCIYKCDQENIEIAKRNLCIIQTAFNEDENIFTCNILVDNREF